MKLKLLPILGILLFTKIAFSQTMIQADTIKIEVSNTKENDIAEIVEFIVAHIKQIQKT